MDRRTERDYRFAGLVTPLVLPRYETRFSDFPRPVTIYFLGFSARASPGVLEQRPDKCGLLLLKYGYWQTMTPIASHAGMEQFAAFTWHVVPPGHGVPPSVSQRCAQVPPIMHTEPDGHGAASPPQVWVLVEQASPPASSVAIARSRRMI